MEEISKISSAAVSLVIAILSGLGVGSGGLFVIWLTIIQGVGAVEARGMNLLFFVFSASAALLFHLGRRHINFKLIVVLSIFASLGTLAGTFVGDIIDPSLLKKIFGGMLILSGLYTLFGKKKQISTDNTQRKMSVSN